MAALCAGAAHAEPVTITSQFGAKKTVHIVYELTDDADKPAAVEYIKAIRDMAFKDADLTDAKTASQTVLHDKLADGFVLYSVFGEDSALLNYTAKPLILKTTDSGISFLGQTFPGKDFRLHFVGDNPYANGKSVVYATTSNKLIKGINSLYSGPKSYHLYSGTKLIAEGLYNDKFVLDDGTISAAEAMEDITELFDSLQDVHPNLLAKITPDDYLALKSAVINEMVGKVKKGRINTEDFAYILYYAVAYFQDGHTSIYWSPREWKNPDTKSFPPFFVEWRNGKFFIKSAADAALENMELISINGVPFLGFISPILDRCSGETLTLKTAKFTAQQNFWWPFSKLLSGGETLKVEISGKKGTRQERTLAPVNSKEFAEISKKIMPAKKETSVQLYKKGEIAHFVYPQCDYNQKEMDKVSAIFREARNAKALIIDIRGNRGGNSLMSNFIMRHITDKPFMSGSKGYEKISRRRVGQDKALKDYASLTGLLISGTGTERRYDPLPNAFKGKVFLLIDNDTFSSALMLAAMFRDYGCGEIIGYETGGLPIHFGDLFSMRLKNSGITYASSFKQFYNARPQDGDDRHGIMPTVPVTEAILAKYEQAGDPVLAFTLDYVNGKL